MDEDLRRTQPWSGLKILKSDRGPRESEGVELDCSFHGCWVYDLHIYLQLLGIYIHVSVGYLKA